MSPTEKRQRNAMMLLTAGWVMGLAVILLLGSMAVYQFDTSRFGRDDPQQGILYTLLALCAVGTLTAATRNLYRHHWGDSART
ncbi:MAG TPA: hypothetical protein VK960_08025 [Acidimicrobiia bacterium]|nr:hypothetical protein [Acidimicrobiia bacterium]